MTPWRTCSRVIKDKPQKRRRRAAKAWLKVCDGVQGKLELKLEQSNLLKTERAFNSEWLCEQTGVDILFRNGAGSFQKASHS
jgi:hypothetical protein